MSEYIINNNDNINNNNNINNNEKEEEEAVDIELLNNLDKIIANDDNNDNNNDNNNNIMILLPPIANLRNHLDSVYSVSLTYMNTFMLLSGGMDDKCYLWMILKDNNNNNNNIWCVWDLVGHTDTIIETKFHPILIKKLEKINGNINNIDINNELYNRPIDNHERICITGCYDGKIRVYQLPNIDMNNNDISLNDTLTLEPIRELSGQDDIEFMEIHYLGDIVATGSQDTTIWVWNIRSGKCLHVLVGHEGSVTCGKFAGKNERLLISGSEDCTVRIWGLKKGVCLHVFSDPYFFHEGPITNLSLNPINEFQILSTSMDGTICLINLETKKIMGKYRHSLTKDMVKKMNEVKIISQDNNNDNDDNKNNENEENDEENIYSIECAKFSNTHPWFASGGIDGKLKIWNLDNLQCRRICRHEGTITSLKWHQEYPFIYTICSDGYLRLWDARNGNLLQQFSGHQDIILTQDLIFSLDISLLNILNNNDDNQHNDNENKKNDNDDDDDNNNNKEEEEEDGDDNDNNIDDDIEKIKLSTKLDVIATGGDDNQIFLYTFDPSSFY